MTIKNVVESLFVDNTNYATPDQATNQASSLDALSIDLYTDSKRFIYELLQNADDSPQAGQQVKVWIKAFNNVLVVAHSGRAFNERDVRGLCNVNNGTKKEDASKTGYKGIGFKSVFGQSKEVTIYTSSEYFRFDASFPFGWPWSENREDWERNNDREFVQPWQIIPIYTDHKDVLEPVRQYLQTVNAKVATIIKLEDAETNVSAIKELSKNVNMFLFLKNISIIYFELDEVCQLDINRLKMDGIELKENGSVAAKWLTYTIHLNIPSKLSSALAEERNVPDKLLNAKDIELTLAANIGEDGISEIKTSEKLIYSYLPTDESKYRFPILVNTIFLTSANREHLHVDSKWNQWLFENIAIELFKWISKLVVTHHKFNSYRLIPQKILNDELGKHFNSGLNKAIDTVSFVLTRHNQLVKIQDAIIDFTYLSEKTFVGEEVKMFLCDFDSTGETSNKSFVKNSGFGSILKSLGAESFEWKDLSLLLRSTHFSGKHSTNNNIELINHLRNLSSKDSISAISDDSLRGVPFIFDHKNRLNIPSKIYFPTAEDNNWNDSESELAFLHKDIQEWISLNPDVRAWIEQLGVIEKTDISFITKTIIPNSKNYIDNENAIQAIRDLFNLYKKEELSSNLLAQLSDLKLLTSKGSLVPAKNCILSSDYTPRLKIEAELGVDVFVSSAYMDNKADKDEWKRFFKIMNVSEGIDIVIYGDRIKNTSLMADGFIAEYFNEDDKKFSPHLSTFTSDEYNEFSSLSHIHRVINNYPLSKPFWEDVISNYPPSDLSRSAIAYWGNTGMPGRSRGDQVKNYIQWFIKNSNAIPVTSKECKSSSETLLNTEEIENLAGEYLPVFDGVQLSSDWKSFFQFRTNLQLLDYLKLLGAISTDVSDKKEVKKVNVNRIQLIYKRLLDVCINWGSSEHMSIADWASSGLLLTTKNVFSNCKETKYFIDGNNGIFQDHFKFLELNHENRQHSNIVELLRAFKVTILEQKDFALDVVASDPETTLYRRLLYIAPFLKAWIACESGDEKTKRSLTQIEAKLDELDVYEVEKLQITYKEISFTKSINVHLDKNKLYVTKPWTTNKVLLQLPGMLCRYLGLIGHDKKLNFLICSTAGEIIEYFDQESIDIKEEVALEEDIGTGKPNTANNSNSLAPAKSFEEIKTAISNGASLDLFHVSTSDYKRLLFVEKLISRSVENIIKYLDSLPEYNCEKHFAVAPSIIGGITKNGQDLTIVARPSDNNSVLLYYTSEFDVLEYVDAEFWCEDGVNIPQKVTLGHFLKMTKINKIPVSNLKFEEQELEEFIKTQKSIDFEFYAVPSSPYKTAQIISSFANTKGGTLIYGINKIGNNNVGLSTDFRMDEITKKALIMISPLPTVTYDWVNIREKNLFVIKVEKSKEDMLIGGKKYIRDGNQTKIKDELSINTLSFSETEKSMAIIIGIENYKPRQNNQVPPVKYAKEDALLFKSMLIERFNIEEKDIYMFINEDALKSDLKYELKGLFHSLSEKDRLIFYYVGHGFHNGTTNYLSTYDTHINNIAETAVSMRRILLDPLVTSKCKSGLVFIDACAQSFKHNNERALISDLNDDDFQLFKSEHPHFATFLSCQPGQSSYSCDDLKHGIWTHHLCKAFRGEEVDAVKSDRYITDRTLNDYLAKSVSAYAKNEHNFEQNPKAILDSNCENILIEI